MKYAVIQGGKVANIIVADEPIEGLEIVPADGAMIGDLYQDGQFISPPSGLTEADFVAAMDAMFDSAAQCRHYDNRITCALRAGYAGPFQAEGQAFATWMDACYAQGYVILKDVQDGKRQPPATIEALIAELPKLAW